MRFASLCLGESKKAKEDENDDKSDKLYTMHSCSSIQPTHQFEVLCANSMVTDGKIMLTCMRPNTFYEYTLNQRSLAFGSVRLFKRKKHGYFYLFENLT